MGAAGLFLPQKDRLQPVAIGLKSKRTGAQQAAPPTTDPCVDGVIHVHAPLVTKVCGLKADLVDLADLISLTNTW